MSTAPEPTPLRIGILAVQGDYEAHAAALSRAAEISNVLLTSVLVRKPEQLSALDGLILPGGESTTVLRFLERDGFLPALQAFAAAKPTFGTCAGAILLSKEVLHPAQASLKVLDAAVERNAYGRQNDSAILHAPTALGGPPMEMVFIRAPRFSRLGPGVRTLAARDGAPTLVEERNILAATFHPELSSDARLHAHFLGKVRGHKAAAAQPEARA